MAVIKHISVKGSNGGDALNYVLYKHNEKTGEMVVDGRGNPIMRDEYYLDGINCEPYSFAAECKEVNDLFGKNQLPGDIKAHHFIISYDPKDGNEHGLTGPKAQQLSIEWAERCLPGFQILVCTHMDGSNESGNIHTHIMMNSVRKNDTDPGCYGERPIDHMAGYKLHLTDDYLRYMKQELMIICEREGLHQVDLLSVAKDNISDREYRVQQHGQEKMEQIHEIAGKSGIEQTVFQTQKQYLRNAIKTTASQVDSFDSFCEAIKAKYDITVKESRGRISYLHPEREKYITGRSLGSDYEKPTVLNMILEREKLNCPALDDAQQVDVFPNKIKTVEDSRKVFVMHSELKLVVRLQECAKAQSSARYANKLMVSHVKAMAETILFVQQNGYENIADIQADLQKLSTEGDSIQDSILNEKIKLKDLNEKIHYLGQYYATKKVNTESHSCDNKIVFSQEHKEELAKYKKATEYLYRTYGDQKFPTMKSLKGERVEMEENMASLNKQKNEMKRKSKTLFKVLNNIYNMTAQEQDKSKYSEATPREDVR